MISLKNIDTTTVFVHSLQSELFYYSGLYQFGINEADKGIENAHFLKDSFYHFVAEKIENEGQINALLFICLLAISLFFLNFLWIGKNIFLKPGRIVNLV